MLALLVPARIRLSNNDGLVKPFPKTFPYQSYHSPKRTCTISPRGSRRSTVVCKTARSVIVRRLCRVFAL